jgi:DMSO/TMAO reductase YedYZ molybdopterin-dependent catalytic subunit
MMAPYDMDKKMRIMSERPLNAETPHTELRSWITANAKFFARNQSEIPKVPVALAEWTLTVTGEVKTPLHITFEQILGMPKAIVANTLECSGNSRSLLKLHAQGNPWTVGGIGNAVWGGVLLRDLLEMAELTEKAKHVGFEGFDKPLGKAAIKFVRSIPLEKAISSTLLAYEMNGDPLPLKNGYPLRALALGWTGANSVKWLREITVLDRPYEGFYMDKVYRVFQKSQDPAEGSVVTGLKVKSFITQPLQDEELPPGPITILGSAYAGEVDIESVEISVDGGAAWHAAELIGLHAKYAWRHWQYVWEARKPGTYTLMCRAMDSEGNSQPMEAEWNVLGYGNNGISEHAVRVHIGNR